MAVRSATSDFDKPFVTTVGTLTEEAVAFTDELALGEGAVRVDELTVGTDVAVVGARLPVVGADVATGEDAAG